MLRPDGLPVAQPQRRRRYGGSHALGHSCGLRGRTDCAGPDLTARFTRLGGHVGDSYTDQRGSSPCSEPPSDIQNRTYPRPGDFGTLFSCRSPRLDFCCLVTFGCSISHCRPPIRQSYPRLPPPSSRHCHRPVAMASGRATGRGSDRNSLAVASASESVIGPCLRWLVQQHHRHIRQRSRRRGSAATTVLAPVIGEYLPPWGCRQHRRRLNVREARSTNIGETVTSRSACQ